MFSYRPVNNHDDLLNVADGLLQEAGLSRADLGGKLTFAGMDPIRPTKIKVGSAAAAVSGANAIASALNVSTGEATRIWARTVVAALLRWASVFAPTKPVDLMRCSAFFFVTVTAVVSLLLGSSSPAQAQNQISFTKQVKPILDKKCVACHACYDAPGQLDLTSVRGIQRGALKFDPYSKRMSPEPPTFLWSSANTTEDWRKIGFFSVTEGGASSIMGKMLALGFSRKVTPNARFPADIELDSLIRKNHLPDASEIDGYVRNHPAEGMPLGTAGLSQAEYSTLMKWLVQGAKYDLVAPQPTAIELAKVKEWESFLNATDKKSALIARYIYEHSNLFVTYFDASGSGNYYQLVRSSTPSGKEPIQVNTRFPNAPIEGPFYYRYKMLDRTVCSKSHQLLYDLSGNKLERYKRIFSETEWSVDTLPGYSVSERFDPLGTFAAIPAKTRYKFLLADIRIQHGAMIWGPFCRGDGVVKAVQDVEWHFFENPETSLYVNDAAYRSELAPYLKPPSEPDDLFAFFDWLRTFAQLRRDVHSKAETSRAARLATKEAGLSRITDIWRGEEPGDTPIFITFRNGDNAYIVEPNVVVGDYPKTVNILDLPILEMVWYATTVNSDIFGNVAAQLTVRDGYGLLRRVAEANFLRFLPQERRQAIYESWYQGELSEFRRKKEMDFGPDISVPAAIQFKTDDPKNEFLAMLLDYFGARVKTADPINRPGDGKSSDPVTKAMQKIVAAANDQPARKFKNMLPEATFLRIDAPGRDAQVYTMTLDRWYATKDFMLALLDKEDPAKAKVTIYPGILTAYPNFIFRIDEADVDKFADALVKADTQEQFTRVVERWGVRRSSPNFWEVVNSVTDYVRKKNPLEAGVFDVNRYKNL